MLGRYNREQRTRIVAGVRPASWRWFRKSATSPRADRQRIPALLELGWSHRRIGREAGVDREMVARYARAGPSKPANLIVGEKPSTSGPRSPAADHDAFIHQGVKQRLSTQRIWQDLVEQYGYARGYLTVQRYVRRLKDGGRSWPTTWSTRRDRRSLCGVVLATAVLALIPGLELVGVLEGLEEWYYGPGLHAPSPGGGAQRLPGGAEILVGAAGAGAEDGQHDGPAR